MPRCILRCMLHWAAGRLGGWALICLQAPPAPLGTACAAIPGSAVTILGRADAGGGRCRAGGHTARSMLPGLPKPAPRQRALLLLPLPLPGDHHHHRPHRRLQPLPLPRQLSRCAINGLASGAVLQHTSKQAAMRRPQHQRASLPMAASMLGCCNEWAASQPSCPPTEWGHHCPVAGFPDIVEVGQQLQVGGKGRLPAMAVSRPHPRGGWQRRSGLGGHVPSNTRPTFYLLSAACSPHCGRSGATWPLALRASPSMWM